MRPEQCFGTLIRKWITMFPKKFSVNGGLMTFRIFFLVAFLSILNGCASTSAVQRSRGSTSVDPSLKGKIKGSGSIELLEHQLLPIDYLHKNPSLHGLLINHYMGTGKTFLGIGFAESFPEHPVIILAPRFLESQWFTEIERYGVKNPKRYTFVSYDDAAEKLGSLNLTNHVILADEIHNLAKRLRSTNPIENAAVTKVYLNLQTAYKVIGLTGTPVYGDESDLAFILNLVAGTNIMPTNQETFRLEYTTIHPSRKFFRGYLTESNLVQLGLTGFLGMFGFSVFGPWGLLGIPLGLGLTVGSNYIFDTSSFKFRALNVEKMAPLMTKYVSYFRFDDSHFKDFPAQTFEVKQVPYNKFQYSFFLRLVEGDLPVDQLQRLLMNDNIKRTEAEVRLNSSLIHEQFYAQIGAARDIGNFEFKNEVGELVEPPKFMAIYKELLKNNEQTVLYSNYFNTGTLAFEKFLKRQGFDRPYGIIEPTQSPDKVRELVKAYNDGKIKLLMLHPDITEGISLKGTQYLHILEPMLNSTVLEQVVGRTRRFQSHSHLPKEKQQVHVTMWQSTSTTWHPDLGVINRANWYKRYREISYMSRWGIGVSQVDTKYHRKALNPEELSYIKLQTLEQNLSEMQNALTEYSIENLYSLGK